MMIERGHAVLRLLAMVVALWAYPAAAFAQMSILPARCAGKTGGELDNCVREITPAIRTQRLEPVEGKADPKQIMDCPVVYRADQGFCIARNEILLECRNRVKHPDADQCIASNITRPPLPQVADCSRVPREARDSCFLRNRVFKDCLNDPLRYFICLGEKMSRK